MRVKGHNMATITANGITMAYEIEGSGPPLVLVAGLGYSRWMWHKMIPGLAEQFTVLSYDNRGVGETDKPAGPYTAHLLAEDLCGLLEVLGMGATAVFGHSMGGLVTIRFIESQKPAAKAVCLSSPALGLSVQVPRLSLIHI